jgi:hypothetical protein
MAFYIVTAVKTKNLTICLDHAASERSRINETTANEIRGRQRMQRYEGIQTITNGYSTTRVTVPGDGK